MINTLSQFWYGWEVTDANKYIDFQYDTDLTPRLATLTLGKYSSRQLCDAISLAMNTVGTTNFFVTLNRTTKCFNILSSANFKLLCSTGPSTAGANAWGLLGFNTTADKTGAMTYSADYGTNKEWRPQFLLQGVTTPGMHKGLRDPVYVESAAGIGELSHFGVIDYIEFEATFITDIIGQKVIQNDPQGVENVNAFLQWATLKANFEFMPDRSNPSTFYEMKLESTQTDAKGLGYKLIEQYDKGLPNYYRTGTLKGRIDSAD